MFKAIEFAVHVHSGQYRKRTNLPYIIHPLGVAKILIERGCSDDVVAAGILHDTVEDTSTTCEDIEREFNAHIANLVAAVTVPDKARSWEERKQHVIDTVRTCGRGVLCVELADKLDNIRSIRENYERIGDAVWSRFNRPKEKQKWYYTALAQVFAERCLDEPAYSLSEQFNNEVQIVFHMV
jgi:(p)ppGpp synthase/HD superfamily hydrolase